MNTNDMTAGDVLALALNSLADGEPMTAADLLELTARKVRSAHFNRMAQMGQPIVTSEQDCWIFNVQTGEIIDADDMTVARDVLPQDAPLIMLAPRLRTAAAALVEDLENGCAEAPKGAYLAEVLDLITAHEQESVPRNRGGRLAAAETPEMAIALATAAAWFAEYADGHDAQGKAGKAARNRERAAFCTAVAKGEPA